LSQGKKVRVPQGGRGDGFSRTLARREKKGKGKPGLIAKEEKKKKREAAERRGEV